MRGCGYVVLHCTPGTLLRRNWIKILVGPSWRVRILTSLKRHTPVKLRLNLGLETSLQATWRDDRHLERLFLRGISGVSRCCCYDPREVKDVVSKGCDNLASLREPFISLYTSWGHCTQSQMYLKDIDTPDRRTSGFGHVATGFRVPPQRCSIW